MLELVFRRTLYCVLLTTVNFLGCAPTTQADIRLPGLMADGAVLQRQVTSQLWGWGSVGETVRVYLDGRLLGESRVDKGQWWVDLPPQKAGGPHSLEFKASNTLLLSDIYFGDVWIASGQSNMQIPMARVAPLYPEELTDPKFSRIRQFVVPRLYDFNWQHSDVAGGRWQAADSQALLKFSAVGYFFARELQQKYKVPIGIINSSVGGSRADSWLSEEALKKYPQYFNRVLQYRSDDYLQQLITSDKQQSARWYQNLKQLDAGLRGPVKWFEPNYDATGWASVQMPEFWPEAGVSQKQGSVWLRKTFVLPPGVEQNPAKLNLGRIVDADTVYLNGVEVGSTSYQYPPRRYSVAPKVLKTGKNTLVVRVVNSAGKGGLIKDKPYSLIATALHNNVIRVDLAGTWQFKVAAEVKPMAAQKFVPYKPPLGFYNGMIAPLLHTPIKGVIWYQGESNVDTPEDYGQVFPHLIRDWRKQFNQGAFPFIFVQLPNYNKPVAEPGESAWAEVREAQRLALSEPNTAMAVTTDVGEWNDLHPLNKKTVATRLALAARKLAYGDTDVVYSGPAIKACRLQGGQAELEFNDFGGGLSFKGNRLGGFAIAAKSGPYVWAQAVVKEGRILLGHPSLKEPHYVRYGWADNPITANLTNHAGLPASPFQCTLVSDGGK